MALDVIGAGFGRTGTLSLKAALERLGFSGCYHMSEVIQHPEHALEWTRAAGGEPVDWDSFLDGYRAVVDWPACEFWRELMAAYPDAKVVLSVRDADRWYDSFRSTIYEVLTRPVPEDLPFADAMRAMGERVVIDRSFGGDLAGGDRDRLVACFERHNETVRREVPDDRLLVYEVKEGWEPLCAFLGVAVPDEPFPNVNDREFFRALFGIEGG